MTESGTRRFRLLAGGQGLELAETTGHDHRSASRAGTALSPIRVLIATSHALAGAGYRALLESDERIEVVAEAVTRQEAIRLAGESEPHVAMLDLSLAGPDDPEAIAAMVSNPAFAGVAVMLIALPDSDARVLSALRAGAIGVLANDAEPAELIGAVELLARGKALLPVGAMRRLLQELAPHSRLDARVAERFSELTDREREIVALAAMGLSNAEIAERLVISTATAKTHVSRAMIKLHARHRAQLVAIAYETGFVRASDNVHPEPGPPVAAMGEPPRVIGAFGYR